MKEDNIASRINKRRAASGLSITWKITIWYTVFLLIVAVLLSLVLFRLYEDRIRSTAENKLVRVVDGLGQIVSDAGEDFILDKKIRYYYKDTYLSVYGMDGDIITGRRPRGIEEFPPLNAEKFQMTEDVSGSEWYCYDNIIEVSGKKVYIRGMLNIVADDDKYSFDVTLAMTLIPLIIIMAGIGGYVITKRAFAPIRKVIGTTEEITRDGDLSRRIPLGKSRDEVYELSESFNNMFDRVEELVNREKKFTADVSHDLRTPLAIIQAQSEFAMEDESYAAEANKVINREARRMSSLINKLMTIIRSDSGRLVPEKAKLDVSFLLDALAEIKRPLAEEKGLRIESEVEEGMEIETDEDMLARIIVNLLDNAIKYNNKDGGIIRISAHKGEKEFVCRVSDDGPGVDPRERDMIWERFYRADEARTSGESSGLGLAIVKALTRNLGGSIELLSNEESELGGATFELKLPC